MLTVPSWQPVAEITGAGVRLAEAMVYGLILPATCPHAAGFVFFQPRSGPPQATPRLQRPRQPGRWKNLTMPVESSN